MFFFSFDTNMQISPFIKTVGEIAPRLLGIQSFAMSLAYLSISLPRKLTEPEIAADLVRNRFNEKEKLQYTCLAHGFNIGGVTAFLYFTHPWGLIAGYILWTGHYLAKLEEKKLERDPSNEDRLWIVLYGFGAITCIACALFAHETIPITVAIVAARVFATTLSSIETGIFFYNFSLTTIFFVKTGAEKAVVWATTPRRPHPPAYRR